MKSINPVIPLERIENRILYIRNSKVMLDKDLAALYNVKPIALRQQVKRNLNRFPNDFMLQLSENEIDNLVSQNVIPSKRSLGGSLPYAFTQEGIAMLSSVLRSKQAIAVNIQIMRAFVRMREMLSSNAQLAAQLRDIEERMDSQEMNTIILMDKLRNIEVKLIKSIKEEKARKKIGFHDKE